MSVKPSKFTRRKKQDRNSIILEILSVIAERNIGKEWLLQEVKKHRIKGIKPIMTSPEILKKCTLRSLSHLLNSLESKSHLPSSLPTTKRLEWFYTDVVASSNPKITTTEQVHKIMVLNDLISRTESFKQQDPKSLVILPSGDGYAIGFDDTIESPLRLAIQLHKLLNEYNQSKLPKDRVYIRSGIESGIGYFMKDLNGNNTVWGPGIIMARRVMDLGEKMHILTTEGIAKVLGRLTPEYKAIMHPIGKYPVKWEGEIEICNIYAEGRFGNRNPPTKPPEGTPINFKFKRVEIILDVKDPKTMMTHHTMTWDLENVSNEPKDLINYSLDGDTPRNFADLHVKVKDSKGKKLKILSVVDNNPRKKQFKVQLDKPITPGSIKTMKLEWDWEEIGRGYEHEMSSECKKFRYQLCISKKAALNQRVLKVIPALGHAEYASPPPVVKFRNGKTIVSWERKNILAHEAYRLEW